MLSDADVFFAFRILHSSRERLMRKHISTIILIIVFFIGLLVLLYPSVSNYINEKHATRAIVNYDSSVNKLDDTRYQHILESARAYNQRIAQKGIQIPGNGAPVDDDYVSQLNPEGDGMMGYIEIKKLGVCLPIYHGTSEEVLVRCAGHLEGTSLPVGGESTHSIITAHRGLPTAKLFTDLDDLEVGDTFQVIIMKEVLTYQVDDISIVLPEDISSLRIYPGKDYFTLITCTPYAVNTHRLLVRGVRIETRESISVIADAVRIDPMLVAPVIAAPMLLVLFIWVFVARGSSKRKGNHSMEDLYF